MVHVVQCSALVTEMSAGGNIKMQSVARKCAFYHFTTVLLFYFSFSQYLVWKMYFVIVALDNWFTSRVTWLGLGRGHTPHSHPGAINLGNYAMFTPSCSAGQGRTVITLSVPGAPGYSWQWPNGLVIGQPRLLGQPWNGVEFNCYFQRHCFCQSPRR